MPLTPALDPNAPLLDVQTESAPDFFVTSDVAFEVAIFDFAGKVMDASTLVAIEADLIDDPVSGNILASASTTNISPDVTIANWRAGTDQQAVLGFDPADLSAIDFRGQATRRLFLAFHAVTKDAAHITIGTGWATLRQGVPGDVRLPLIPVPSVIPAGTTYRIPAGVTITFPVPPKILGNLVLEPAQGRLPAGNFTVSAP